MKPETYSPEIFRMKKMKRIERIGSIEAEREQNRENKLKGKIAGWRLER